MFKALFLRFGENEKIRTAKIESKKKLMKI
jgi:hypothetical protein